MNRERFPGLADGWARLDGPAGTQPVDDAIEAMAAFMRSGANANHGGVFAAGQATDEVITDARASVAALFGADPRGVVFGPSMTALTMRFAATVLRDAGPGDEVVVTRLDHDANVRPWVIAAERAGATVRFAEPDPQTTELSADAVRAVLSDGAGGGDEASGRGRTRWVAVTAASNACGTIPDLPGIVAAAHEAGARVYLDAVHAAPHRHLDLAQLGCDVLACSAYKWFGPHVGILVADPALLEEYRPDKLLPSADEVPDRYELGTLPFEQLAGVTAAARYLASLGWEAVEAHEQAVFRRAHDGLAAIDGVRLIGTTGGERAPTLMFTVDGLPSTEVATRLAADRIAVWHGNYYAAELERFLGLAPEGAVRAGFVHYNDESDADRLVDAVARLRR